MKRKTEKIKTKICKENFHFSKIHLEIHNQTAKLGSSVLGQNI